MENVTVLKDVVFVGEYQIEPYSFIGKLPHNAPADIKTLIGKNALFRSHSVIYAGNMIGDNFQTGHGALIREFNKIGNNVSVGSHSIIEHHVRIGDNVRIHSRAFIPEETILEDNVWVGPGAVITNARYPLSKNVKATLKGAHVKKGAIVGANATLLPGIVIGEHAIIGAGAVVTKNVPAHAVVAGNPAKVINSRKNIKEYKA